MHKTLGSQSLFGTAVLAKLPLAFQRFDGKMQGIEESCRRWAWPSLGEREMNKALGLLQKVMQKESR